MYILHIEHPVLDFEVWKKAFDSDPVGRVRSGVRRYRVSRAVDNPNHVSIDLEFETENEAEGVLGALRRMWIRVEGELMTNPQARIAEIVEAHQY